MTDNTMEHSTTLEAVCTRKDLAEGVQLVAHAVSERNPLPILTHVLIQSDELGLRLSASDLELGISMTIPADVRKPGALTAPARILSDLIASFPEGEITLSADRSHAAKLFFPGSDYRIVGLPPEEYPTLPDVDDQNSFKITQKLLREAIRQTIFSVATENKGRPMLTGVLLDLEGSAATFVATDALRLALRSVPVTEGRGAMQAIVPARALADLQRALSDEEGDVDVRLAEKQALFITPRGVTVTTRLIEGQYPAYRRVVPTSWRTQVTLPTQALHQAVRRAIIVARHAADRLEFRTLDDKAVLTAESATEGKALEEVEMLREGDDVEVAFSGRYLLDVLAAMDADGVAIEMTDPTKAAVVRPKQAPEAEDTGEYVCVLMPLQLV